MPIFYFFAAAFFDGAWVRADAAADLAALLALGSSSTLAAFDATAALVTLLVLVWASAEAATDFSILVALLLASTFDALDAGFLPVDSDFAMSFSPLG
jgi:hypothetical protein